MQPVFAAGDGFLGFLIVFGLFWYFIARPIDQAWREKVVKPTAGPLVDFGKRQAGKFLVNKLKGRL